MKGSIVLEVHGVPMPQGSKTAIVGADGKAHVIEGGPGARRAGLRAWRQAVADAARDWLRQNPDQPAFDEPLCLTVGFRFARTASDRYRTRHAVQPDLSKLARSTEDALVDGGLLVNDSRICELHLAKRYSDRPGATITIDLLGAAEAEDREAAKERRRAERGRLSRPPADEQLALGGAR